MEDTLRNKKYNEYLEAKSPKTKPWPSLFHAFWVGGLICCIGQAFLDGLMAIFPDMTPKDAGTWSLVLVIVIAAIMTGLGIYDNIGAYAGAGSIVPISGFSNSIASPALEYKREGLIFGLCAKLFTIAGPVIVIGVVASMIAGIIYLFI